MVEYELMHIDKAVATINIKNGKVNIIKPDFMPYSLYLETEADDLESSINNINNFYYWCATRLLSLERKFAKEILNSIGAKQAHTDKDRAMIALSYRCLSLRDVYWVREKGADLSFKDIELYSHSLDNALVDVALRGRNLTVNNSSLIASDLSTNGLFPKAWKRQSDGFVLLKDGGKRVVYREHLASEIVKCFTTETIEYKIKQYKGELVTESKIITSLDYSIVPMEEFEIYCVNNAINLQNYVKNLDTNNYYMMNVVDYLIGNTDRHMGNWGLLVDNTNNKPIKLHPLMDYNKSFEAYDDLEGGRCLTVSGVVNQRQAAIEALEHIGNCVLLQEIPYDLFDKYGLDIEKVMFLQRLQLINNILYQ